MELKSWIPPQITWQEFPHSYIVEVHAQAHDLVEFLLKGYLEVCTGGKRIVAATSLCLSGSDTLRGQLTSYVLKAATPQIPARRKSLPKILRIHFMGAWRLPGERKLALLVGLDEPAVNSFPLKPEFKAALEVVYSDFQQRVLGWEAEKEANLAEKEANLKAICDTSPEVAEILKRTHPIGIAEDEPAKPRVELGALVADLPCATFIEGKLARSPKVLQRTAVRSVASSGFLPSRDGHYSGIIVGQKRDRCALVTWQPNLGFPSYPEIRWAVQRALPRAMARPRCTHLGRPKIEQASELLDGAFPIDLPTHIGEWEEILSGTLMDGTDYARRIAESRAKESRTERSTKGFEALAWFQPYHEWTEETWGIYLDAKKLDDFALSIWEDCKEKRFPIRFDLACILALGLIFAHEMFHARVEAAASWQEVSQRLPRYRRYQERVYRALSGTAEWLEEALANWCAYDWFTNCATKAFLTERGIDPDRLTAVVEGVLDLSPPGYQDWRAGRDHETWRVFASQIASAKPEPTINGIALPLESLLRGPLPFDLSASDIPVWFVGRGIIADRLHSHPGSFNVPSRREAVKVLRHFDHRHVPARGKGSHEQWVAPDQRAFVLPTRNPLSRVVFSSMLHHLGIDKKTYVRDIRPKL
jgi:predicted RNA binding protein YcfA (HicA-like mRNA interferase family)